MALEEFNPKHFEIEEVLVEDFLGMNLQTSQPSTNIDTIEEGSTPRDDLQIQPEPPAINDIHQTLARSRALITSPVPSSGKSLSGPINTTMRETVSEATLGGLRGEQGL